MSDLPRTAIADLPDEERQVAEALIAALGDGLAALAWQGSWARGEANAESDHDMFVTMRRLDSELLGKIAKVMAGRDSWSLFIKTEEELRQYPRHGRLQFRHGMTLLHGDFEQPPVARAEVLADVRHLANEVEQEARYRLVHKRDTRQASPDHARHARILYYWAKMGVLALKGRELLNGRDYPLTREALRERISDETELALIDLVDFWPEFRPLYETDFVPMALLLDRFVRQFVSGLPAE